MNDFFKKVNWTFYEFRNSPKEWWVIKVCYDCDWLYIKPLLYSEYNIDVENIEWECVLCFLEWKNLIEIDEKKYKQIEKTIINFWKMINDINSKIK